MPNIPLDPNLHSEQSDPEKGQNADEFVEALENASPEVKSFFAAIMRETVSVKPSSPYDRIASKLDAEHLAKIIEYGERDNDRNFRAYKIDKIIGLTIFLVALLFAGMILLVFRDSQHFTTIMSSLFSFLGGLGVGKFVLQRKDSS